MPILKSILDDLWGSQAAPPPTPPAPAVPTTNVLDQLWTAPTAKTITGADVLDKTTAPSSDVLDKPADIQNVLDPLWTKAATTTPATVPAAAKAQPQPEPSMWSKIGTAFDNLTSKPIPEYVASFFGPKVEAEAKLSSMVSPETIMGTVDQVTANYLASSKHPLISHIGKLAGGINQFEQGAIRSSESPVGLVASAAGPVEGVVSKALPEIAPEVSTILPKARAVADLIFSGQGMKQIIVPRGKNETAGAYAERLAQGAFQTLLPILGHVVPSGAAKTEIESKTTIPVSGEVKGTPVAAPVETEITAPEQISVLDNQPEVVAPQGGHAGNEVASVEELNRPGRFVKVSKSGQLTDQGKTPDFNLKPGEAGYQVKPDGTFEIKAGEETPATRLGVQNYAREVFGNKPVAVPIAKVVTDDYVPTVTEDEILSDSTQRIVDNSPIIARLIDPTKLQTPDDIAAALEQAKQHVDRNLDPRVGARIGFDSQKSLASDLNMTLPDLLSKRSGESYNAEESVAARSMLKSSADRLNQLAQQTASGSESAKSEFALQAATHLELENQILGIRSEAGRGLGSWRINTLDLPEVKVASALAKFDPSLVEQATRIVGKLDKSDPLYTQKANQVLRLAEATKQVAPKTLVKAAQLMGNLDPSAPGFVQNVGKLIAEITPSTTQDKLFEVYRNFLLSAPTTVIKKTASEASMMALETTKKLVQGGLESLRTAVAPSDYESSGAAASEAYWYGKGSLQALAKAKTFLTGQFDLADAPGFEHGSTRAVKGVAGQIVRTPVEIINRLTNMVYAMNYYGQLNSLAARQAISEGLEGEALAARQDFLAQNPTEEMKAAANEIGLHNTFQSKLGKTGQKGSEFISSNPITKALFPFYRTPVNLVKATAEFSPYGYFKGTLNGDLGAQVKGLIGSGIAAAFANLAADGIITGGGPVDFKQRQTLEATGWQPYSIKIGNRYISFNKAEPLGLSLGLVADSVLANLHMEGAEAASRAQNAVNYISRNVQSLPFLNQVSEIVDGLTKLGQGNTAERIADNMAASMVVPAGVKDLAQAIDPTVRTPQFGGIDNPQQGMTQTIESRIPGLTKNVPADIDVSGQPIKRAPSSVGGMNPFPVTAQKNDPVLNEMARLGVSVENAPTKQLTYHGRPTPGGQPTPAEALKLQQLETKEFYQIASKTIANPDWVRIPDNDKQTILKKIRSKVDAGRYGRLLLIRKGKS